MRRFLLSLALLLVPTAGLAQLVAVPTASNPAPQQAKLTWSPGTAGAGQVQCGTANPCTWAVYRFSGTATTANLTQASWTLVTTTAQNATAFTDSPGAGTFSYVVVPTLVSDGLNGGPSNIVVLTLTVPPVPAPATAAGSAGL